MNFRTSTILALLALAGLTLLPSASRAGAYVLDVMALSGQAAPGAPSDWHLGGATDPQIDASGNVAFIGWAMDGNVQTANRRGLWIVKDGTLQSVAFDGDDVNPTAGTHVIAIHSYVLGATGKLAVSAATDAPTPANDPYDEFYPSAVLVGEPGNLSLVAEAGQPPPDGAPGAIDFGQLFLNLSASGYFGFTSATLLANDVFAYDDWRGKLNGTVGPLDVDRQLLDHPDPASFNCCGGFITGISADGDFYAYGVRRDPPGNVQQRGMWRRSLAGDVEWIAIEGDPAPGLDGVYIVVPVRHLSFNDAGDMLFATQLVGLEVYATSNVAIWHWPHGSDQPSLLARGGDPAPGLGGPPYLYLPDPATHHLATPVIGGDGTVAFCGNNGIWAGPPDALRLIARKNRIAPETQETFQGTFLDDTTEDGRCAAYLNGAGEVAFIGRLKVGGGDYANGIWAGEPSQLRLVARTGSVIHLPNHSQRVIRELRMVSQFAAASGGQDGRGTVINDAGQLVFVAEFTDNSQAVIRATPNVPPDAADVFPALVPAFDFLLDE